MQPESRIPFINKDTPQIKIEGIDVVIKLDLGKHKELLDQAKHSLLSFRESVAHLVKRKKHYSNLRKEGKFNADSMKASIDMINIDIRAASDKAKLATEEIDHHTLIVDTLTKQLEDYNAS